MEEPQILVEAQPRLRLVNFYMKFLNCLGESVIVANTETTVTVSSADDKYEFEMLDVKLVPGSATVKQTEAEYLYFQCCSQPEMSTSGSFGLEFLSMGDQKSSSKATKPLGGLKANVKYSVKCSGCSFLVAKDLEFRRVLPLPSDDWESTSTDWFCHEHGPCGSHPKEEKELKKPRFSIQPKIDDCLYGSAFWLLNTDHVKLLTESSKSVLKCPSCGLVVSNKVDSGCILWNHAVRWQDTVEVPEISSAYSDGLSLIGNICDEYPPLTKIAFTADNSDGASFGLLLWVIDRNATLLKKNDGEAFGSIKAYKVLYDLEYDISSLSKWRKDFSTKSVQVTENIVVELYEALSKSNSVMCPVLRGHNTSLVGYLLKE